MNQEPLQVQDLRVVLPCIFLISDLTPACIKKAATCCLSLNAARCRAVLPRLSTQLTLRYLFSFICKKWRIRHNQNSNTGTLYIQVGIKNTYNASGILLVITICSSASKSPQEARWRNWCCKRLVSVCWAALMSFCTWSPLETWSGVFPSLFTIFTSALFFKRVVTTSCYSNKRWMDDTSIQKHNPNSTWAQEIETKYSEVVFRKKEYEQHMSHRLELLSFLKHFLLYKFVVCTIIIELIQ